jgi:diadenosine tetraphosphate (Ap4A) HIT family hydrolase
MTFIFFKQWDSNSSINRSRSRSRSRNRSSSTGLLKISLRISLVTVVLSTIVLIFIVHPLIVNDCVDGFIVAKKKSPEISSPSSSFSPLKQQLQQEQEQTDSMDAPHPPSPRDEEEGINNNSNYLDYDYDYDSNPTAFGKILRGELYGRRPFLKESDNLIAFEDHKPKAKFHALIIPKRYIPTILDLDVNNNDNNNIDNDITTSIATNTSPSSMLSLIEEMGSTAENILEERYPEEYKNDDYILCFHIPPFTSVNHLHLHVLAPASQMKSLYRYGKYNCGSNNNNNSNSNNNNYDVRWCTSLQDVLIRLRTGLPPTPYKKDDNWTTILFDTTSSIRSVLLSALTR